MVREGIIGAALSAALALTYLWCILHVHKYSTKAEAVSMIAQILDAGGEDAILRAVPRLRDDAVIIVIFDKEGRVIQSSISPIAEGELRAPTDNEKRLLSLHANAKQRGVVDLYIGQSTGTYVANFSRFPPKDAILCTAVRW